MNYATFITTNLNTGKAIAAINHDHMDTHRTAKNIWA